MHPKRTLPAWLMFADSEGDGGGDAGPPAGDTDTTSPPKGGTPAGSEHEGGGTGYPSGVPLSDMDKDERIAYWTRNSRRHEDTAKAAKVELDRMLAERMSEQEKAVMAARDEGRQAALTEASVGAAGDIFVAALLTQGVPPEEVEDITRPIDMGSFIADGKLDVPAVRAYAARMSGPPAPKNPDLGQGSRGAGTGRTSGQSIIDQFKL